MNLYDFMTDEALCGTEFLGDSWMAWRVIARLFDGNASLLTGDELELARSLTGRQGFTSLPPPEMDIGAGRRSGKTRFAAVMAVHAAAQNYPMLAPGGFAVSCLVAPDRRQARVAFEYAEGLVMASDMLRAELIRNTTETLEFRHRTRLEVHTGNFRAVRGYSMCFGLIDEAAFLRSEESANPDVELARAMRPALATLGGRMVVISSPHRRVGLLFDGFKKYFGKEDARSFYIQAATPVLNPTLNRSTIDDAMADDPEAGRSEWYGEFRSDLAQFLSDELIDAAIVPNLRSQPMVRENEYFGFVDLSGGRVDASAVAIAHRERDRVIVDRVDLVEGSHDPQDAVARFSLALSSYGLNRVFGDRYAAQWPVAAFAKHGITYSPSTLDRSSIYLEVLPLFASRLIELPDVPRLATELRLLERRPRPGGRDIVDHPRSAHDDVCNAALGAAWIAGKNSWVDNTPGRFNQPSRHVSGRDYDPHQRHQDQMDDYERNANDRRH